jgi:hypothetical protein
MEGQSMSRSGVLVCLVVGMACQTESDCFEQRHELRLDLRERGAPIVASAGSFRFARNSPEVDFTCPEAVQVDIRYSCKGGVLTLYSLLDGDFTLRLREPQAWTATVTFPYDDVVCGRVEPVVVVLVGE